MRLTPKNKLMLVVTLGIGTADQALGQYIQPKVFCEEVEAILCARGVRSCSVDEKSQQKHQCMEFVNPMVEQKSVRYDFAKAKVCLGNLRSPASGQGAGSVGATLPPVCHQVLEPALKAGDPCEWSVSCRAPLVCVKPAGDLKGKCGQGLGKNELCDQDLSSGSFFAAALLRQKGVCAPGLRCIGDKGTVRRCQ